MSLTTRDRLIEAAIGLLDEGGVDRVTLREVGRQSGVSHNAPYKHFASKEALLAAVAARELTGLREDISSRLTPEVPPQEALRTAMRCYLDLALRHPARFRLTFGAWSVQSDDLERAATDAQRLLTDIVSAAQAAGALPQGDPERLAALTRALTHGAADLASTGHLAADGKGHAAPEHLIEDLLAYLRLAADQARSAGADPRGANSADG